MLTSMRASRTGSESRRLERFEFVFSPDRRRPGRTALEPGQNVCFSLGPKTAAGLEFPTGVIVVLEFGPEREVQSLRHQRDIVLQEHVVERQVALFRRYGQNGTRRDSRLRPPIAHAPDDVIARPQREAVLQIEIVGSGKSSLVRPLLDVV